MMYITIMTATPKIHRPTATTLLALAALAVIAAGCAKTVVRKDADTVQTAAAAPNVIRGTFTDSRDGQVYRTVVIGTQRWMAENLNYDVPGVDTDVCYANNSSNCDMYGRLYDWTTAMNLSSGCNYSSSCTSQVQIVQHRGICPVGWHVPSQAEWRTLVKYVDPNASGDHNNIAGTKLKSATGWNTKNGSIPGTDDFGFSALPGGNGSGGSFYNAGYNGYWWSAKEGSPALAREWYMIDHSYVFSNGFNAKTYRFSLRCVEDFAAPQ